MAERDKVANVHNKQVQQICIWFEPKKIPTKNFSISSRNACSFLKMPEYNHNAVQQIWYSAASELFVALVRRCTGLKVWNPWLKAQEENIYARVGSRCINRTGHVLFAGDGCKKKKPRPNNPYSMILYHRRRSSAGGTLII